MPLPAGHRMHTPLCRHASGEPADSATQALKTGLKEIGYSGHSQMRQDDVDAGRMRFVKF
jgi:histidinol phosphatase-like PHP family hydrolase